MSDAVQIAMVRALLASDPELQRFTRAALASIDVGVRVEPLIPHVDDPPGPAPIPAGKFRSERVRRILRAIRERPLTPDELQVEMPDVQRTSLISAVHMLADRGYIEILPVRYALVANPTPRPITEVRAERRGKGRTRRTLTAADRVLLGVESDMAVTSRLGFDRTQIRDLRRTLGIAPVTRGGRGLRPA